MGHTDTIGAHEHHHGHHDEVKHFKRCPQTKHKKCLCATKRFLLSAGWGYIFASIQMVVVFFLAKSFGAEGDAGHTYADSTIILFGALLAYLKYRSVISDGKAEAFGVIVNSVLFFLTAGLVVYHTFHGEIRSLSVLYMFVAGFIGFLGNYIQSKVLGHAHSHGPSTHSTTQQHIFFDMVNSLFVMLTAVLAYSAGLPTHRYWKGALAFAILVLAVVILFKSGKLDWESWGPNQWLLSEAIATVTIVLLVYFVSTGKVRHIDQLTAVIVAIGMVAAGISNLINYTKIKRLNRAHAQ